ncbi:MAG TPA: sigma 54-interacting transcriptional regulator [Smithellaceae bacterium]|jgi:PAS domain S-box-containing protein|nr:sigma 54-interacting transcriptional regulator [Smithellaceae bacterium]HOM68956.1 sigma 54-interacting transcriptional regulator [Smithellaceae bacterium]HOS08976.1 sigma 54-interacting transcriptional regulator [Smithellaceae bacterium]HOU05313.1 sigma 54-interacting transcriptional regulator [Smithellaceae bacterium]HPD49450.1 sigma 54-interacting transcriptional regulator [Smithellaceae bacterium]
MVSKKNSKQKGAFAGDEQNIILDSIADGVFSVDKDWRISSFNRAAEKITGVSRKDAVGQLCKDVLKADICERNCCLRATMRTGKPIVNRNVYIIDAEGRKRPISISTALLRDKKGKLLGAVETFRDISVEEDLRKAIEKKYSFADIISKNHRILQLFDILPDIAASNSTVLIEGESGTGKELFARAIHDLSSRKNQLFVAVNCSALPDTLLESELFGYKEGAFTDAKKDKPGRFRLAENGTLFLDEIGEITPSMQVKLLRVLQEKTYEPLGATQSVEHNVRIIAATNKDLDVLVREGSFREDLYYRINVFKIILPPLRERMEDIPLLIDHFIERFNVLQKKSIQGVSEEAMSALMSYSYPGNIRELANIIERAFILCKTGLIEKKHLPESLFAMSANNKDSKVSSLRDVEAAYLLNALKQNNWDRQKTARQIGIHKSTLYRKIKSLDIVLP